MTLRTEVWTVTPERATKMLATQTNVRVIRKAIVVPVLHPGPTVEGAE